MKKIFFALLILLTLRGFSQEIKISRSVVIQLNQTLDVNYPGSGWIFLGETSETGILRMIDRRPENHSTHFSFRANSPGKTVVRFYRQDFLKQQFLNDALEVCIVDFDLTAEDTVVAPDFFMAEALPEEKQSSEPIFTEKENDLASAKLPDGDNSVADTSEVVSSNQILSETKEMQKNGEIVKAINHLDAALPNAKTQLDELMFLRGQLYEAKSILQNIRRSLESYEIVMNSHPTSPLYESAADRARYIKSYYFDIK
jgi:hypothetical protein